MKTIAFFNNKGGVGKTTLVYHLAWMFAGMGRRVLVADLDPQANLTSMFLAESELEKLWDPDREEHPSIMAPLSPMTRGLGDIGETPTQRITNAIWLIPGDLALSNFESNLSEAWGKCLDGQEPAFRTTSAFHRVMLDAYQKTDADVVLIDVGPNFGAINRAALICAESVVVPLAPDLFSIQGLRNLGPTLKDWRTQWKRRFAENPAIDLPLPKGMMNPVGYTVIQFGIRDSRPVKAYQKWSNRIPSTFDSLVLENPKEDISKTYENDPNCLGMLKHYRSLMPMAMEARKPIFNLSAADGAIGAHAKSVQDCKDDFKNLAKNILAKYKF
ncbi:MAG: ParA family protein [Verrucomicrobia bacterium]|nr:ParA family protein [Verrucomicrobiota bacterium]MCH8511152.1 AAA family ATPase [Kiritimatiellia bacterium]